MEGSPIFIISSERSGSNLLRSLLGNHSNISAPASPHLLISFYSLIPYYDPLNIKINWSNLFADFLQIVNHPYHNWRLSLNFDNIYEKYQPNCFMDCIHIFYNEYALKENKRRFVCKENNIYHFSCHLLNYYKKPKFIYLYRDPRDYVASWMKLPDGPNTPFSAANMWLEEQKACEILIKTFGLEVYPIKYEKLITDTSKIMSDLLLFLNEPIEDACFELREGENFSLSWNLFWKNLNNKIMIQNYNKYKDIFNLPTINLIETITREYMIKFKYEFDSKANWKKPFFFKYVEKYQTKIRAFKTNRDKSKTKRILSSRRELARSIAEKRKYLFDNKVLSNI